MEDKGRGWLLFSMIVLLTAGIMRVFDGIWLIHNANVLNPASINGDVLGSSFKTYGWTYLAVGAILILAALGLTSGSELSRWIGVFAGAVLAISSMWLVFYQPFWSILYVGIGVGLIYGLVAYAGHDHLTEMTGGSDAPAVADSHDATPA